MKNQNKKGFNLIEVLFVVGIIGVLASVAVVNLSGVRVKARDNAVFTQISSTQGLAFKCLTNGITGVELKNTPHPTAGADICTTAGYSTWPVLTANSDWIYSDTRFRWCNLSTGVVCDYGDSICGGSNKNGAFCYKLINNADTNKIITCTQNGCVKSGF